MRTSDSFIEVVQDAVDKTGMTEIPVQDRTRLLSDNGSGYVSLDGAKDHLELLDELGLLCCIIPELAPAKGVDQPREHYWDVFDHSLHSVEGV